MKPKIFDFPENISIEAKSDVTLIKKDGFTFYNITAVHVKFDIGGLKFHMGNLFDGIKALGKLYKKNTNYYLYSFHSSEESTNAYLNANWRPVAESLNPILTKTVEDIMIGILKTVFDNLPADFFLSDIGEDLDSNAA